MEVELHVKFLFWVENSLGLPQGAAEVQEAFQLWTGPRLLGVCPSSCCRSLEKGCATGGLVNSGQLIRAFTSPGCFPAAVSKPASPGKYISQDHHFPDNFSSEAPPGISPFAERGYEQQKKWGQLKQTGFKWISQIAI